MGSSAGSGAGRHLSPEDPVAGTSERVGSTVVAENHDTVVADSHRQDSGSVRPGRHESAAEEGLTADELIARARPNPVAPDDPHRSDEPSATPVDAPLDDAAGRETRPVLYMVGDLMEPEPMSTDPVVIERKSRAGRDLRAAVSVALGLGAVILTSLFVYRPSFLAVLTLAAVVAVYEMVIAFSVVEGRPPLVPLVTGAVAMELAAWFRGPDGLVGALLLSVIGLLIWRLADGATGYLRDAASGALIALYVPFLTGFAVLLTRSEDGAARVIIFILAVVCSDTGGYAAGVLAGRHPLAPTVSPKKSWEGFAGSLLASSLCGGLVMSLTFHQGWWRGVIFGSAIAVTATLGDLGESMIKRDLTIKDMGRLLPGHGGIMDRLDSLLPCAAVAYLLLNAFAPV
jgi:phosphatidate cytidylyltransferase